MKPRVLVVDDDADDRRLIQRALGEDFEIMCAGSGEEGLELLDQAVFDVVLADYRLPGISGIEFVSRAAILQPDAGRLMITGEVGMDRTLFPVAMLFKPVPPEVLKRFVSQLSVLTQKQRALRARGGRLTEPGIPAIKKP